MYYNNKNFCKGDSITDRLYANFKGFTLNTYYNIRVNRNLVIIGDHDWDSTFSLETDFKSCRMLLVENNALFKDNV